MSSDLLISVCLNSDSNFVETFQIPYNIQWADLHAMVCCGFVFLESPIGKSAVPRYILWPNSLFAMAVSGSFLAL